MSITLNSKTKTLVNNDTDKTYTFGKRGKRPNWVNDWIENHPEKYQQLKTSTSVTPIDPKDVEYEIVYDKETQTLSNVTLNKTYTFGQKGKKAKWVKKWIENNETEVPQKQEEKQTEKQTEKSQTLREWHFRSEMNNQCIVIAKDEIQAIYLLNKIFKYKYNSRQFEIFFKETDYVSGFDIGVWRWNNELNTWENHIAKKVEMK